MRMQGGKGPGEGVRNHLQSTPQHFRNLRSPMDREDILPDWLIKYTACKDKREWKELTICVKKI